ncbi:DNA methyltransferase [Pseudomonas guariconensis]|uniref:DNA methyltransferase n=1 Tax=Pseudomonas guariconensis TaxID=1288410 RepID=UPI0039063B33
MKSFRSRSTAPGQGELFGAAEITAIYESRPDAPLDNATLYKLVAKRAGLDESALNSRVPVGKSGQRHSLERRAIRWTQQDLRRAGVLERVPGARGIWRLTEEARRGLSMAKPGVKVLGFRTDLGVAIFGGSEHIFRNLDVQPISIICSPPYPLAKPRAYGNPSQNEIVKFIMDTLEPLIERMPDSGSLALNLSQDIFLPGSAARSTYIERLTIALEDAGLALMDRIVWKSNKPPGPIRYASITRQTLNVAYEPILIWAKCPARFKGDNRRVLEPHTDRHLALIAAGGETRTVSYGDGAYQLRPGAYGTPTEGRIPKNVLERGLRCAYGNQYRAAAERLGLPVHGAAQPYSVAEFLIRYLTEEGDLVVDPWAGRSMTGLAAEMLNRTWICGERSLEYIRGGAELFRDQPGFYLNPQIERAFGRVG